MDNQNNNQTTRRIDDLGRIYIPKSIRRQLDIKEDDMLMIKVDTDNDCIIVKKDK